MTHPTDPSRFPVEFRQAFAAVQDAGELPIPSGSPHALKVRLWAFQRALRKHGQTELADSVQILVRPGGVLLQLRSRSREGMEIAAALANLPHSSPPDADSLFERLPQK